MQLFPLWKQGLRAPLSKNGDEENKSLLIKLQVALRQMGDEAMELDFVPFNTQLFLNGWNDGPGIYDNF